MVIGLSRPELIGTEKIINSSCIIVLYEDLFLLDVTNEKNEVKLNAIVRILIFEYSFEYHHELCQRRRH